MKYLKLFENIHKDDQGNYRSYDDKQINLQEYVVCKNDRIINYSIIIEQIKSASPTKQNDDLILNVIEILAYDPSNDTYITKHLDYDIRLSNYLKTDILYTSNDLQDIKNKLPMIVISNKYNL